MEDELVLIGPANFEPERISREHLLSMKLLLREQGSGSRRVVETALEKAGYKLKAFTSVMDLDSTETIKSAVEAGLGLGFVSRWAVTKELELRALKVVEVTGLRISRHFSLVSRSGPDPQGPAGAFRTFALARARLLSGAPRKATHSRGPSR
jgi:DNA-binding transcriptional LysR family regulator